MIQNLKKEYYRHAMPRGHDPLLADRLSLQVHRDHLHVLYIQCSKSVPILETRLRNIDVPPRTGAPRPGRNESD